MSGASVYLFDDMVLKVQASSVEAENEYAMLRWMDGKLPVPKIIEYENTNKLSYLLMSRCAGEIACCDSLMSEPKKLARLLSETLQLLWSIDCTDCPVLQSLDKKLLQAEYNVSNDLVDIQNCAPDTFSKDSFKDPGALLNWLKENKPVEHPVLSHGDFCLPNILFLNDKLTGLIDVGRSGLADQWCDLALCYRSLVDNYNGKYAKDRISSFQDRYLFDALQIVPDWDKIRYYILLDELF